MTASAWAMTAAGCCADVVLVSVSASRGYTGKVLVVSSLSGRRSLKLGPDLVLTELVSGIASKLGIVLPKGA